MHRVVILSDKCHLSLRACATARMGSRLSDKFVTSTSICNMLRTKLVSLFLARPPLWAMASSFTRFLDQ